VGEVTGKLRDNESGLDFFGARYFSGAQGRFTTPDWSEKPEPIPYATLSDPQTLNLYAYLRNNPLNRADADGHCGFFCNLIPQFTAWTSRRIAQQGPKQFAKDVAIGAGKGLAQMGYGVVATSAAAQGNPVPLVTGPPKAISATNETQAGAAVATQVVAGIGLMAAGGGGGAGTGIATDYGIATQSTSEASMAALGDARAGAELFRQGTFGVQSTAEGQFWSLQNPASTPGYADAMGLPASNSPEWIMGGTLRSGASAVTREAPGLGANEGGAQEVVTTPGGVKSDWFHMPD